MAVRTDFSFHQWASLGGLSAHACLSIPQSCGAAGGAISFWFNILDCPNSFLKSCGLISSADKDGEGILHLLLG